MCLLCTLKREVKAKSFEWYYEKASERFKRIGSAKALRAIYKQRSAVDPRVITLLALCRELQPAQKFPRTGSFRRTRSASSKDDESAAYMRYSSSEAETGMYQNREKYRRKRYMSESEAVLLQDMIESEDDEPSLKERLNPLALSQSRSRESRSQERSRALSSIDTTSTEMALLQVTPNTSNSADVSHESEMTSPDTTMSVGVLTEVRLKLGRSSETFPPIQ